MIYSMPPSTKVNQQGLVCVSIFWTFPKCLVKSSNIVNLLTFILLDNYNFDSTVVVTKKTNHATTISKHSKTSCYMVS